MKAVPPKQDAFIQEYSDWHFPLLYWLNPEMNAAQREAATIEGNFRGIFTALWSYNAQMGIYFYCVHSLTVVHYVRICYKHKIY